MPTRVFLMRHAESSNPLVFHGAESDVGLSERGLLQAEALARHLSPHQPHAVIASAMLRARLTAKPLAVACGRELLLEPDLHERRVGALSGMPFGKTGIWHETEDRWAHGDTAFAPPGAESFDEIQRRVVPVWERLLRTHADRTLAIVAHGVVVKVLLTSVLPEWSPRDWHRLGSIRNCAVSEVAMNDGVLTAARINEAIE